uniref:Uncharacterized protein n=1 Tax=Sphaerodactylus townsendi TaxID=933632 RepID=A0ACB8EZJ3_9SAUR
MIKMVWKRRVMNGHREAKTNTQTGLILLSQIANSFSEEGTNSVGLWAKDNNVKRKRNIHVMQVLANFISGHFITIWWSLCFKKIVVAAADTSGSFSNGVRRCSLAV